MAAMARALWHGFSGSGLKLDSFEAICLFCGVGLTVSLFLAAYGFDLNPGF
jgi:hypothetical protein